jgi:hypothetical protein
VREPVVSPTPGGDYDTASAVAVEAIKEGRANLRAYATMLDPSFRKEVSEHDIPTEEKAKAAGLDVAAKSRASGDSPGTAITKGWRTYSAAGGKLNRDSWLGVKVKPRTTPKQTAVAKSVEAFPTLLLSFSEA